MNHPSQRMLICEVIFEELECIGWLFGLTLISIIGRTQLVMGATMPTVRTISCEFLTELLPIVRYLPLLTIHYKP
jgi:hypothetical protein